MEKINLYKDNNIANQKEVSFEDIYKGFKIFPHFKIHYPKISFENCLRIYIADDNGPRSTYEEAEFYNLYAFCLKQFIKWYYFSS